jgi:flap endonuclease-1
MIRNITNRQGPLVIVSGAEIRTVLQLDRARYVDFALLLGTDFSQRIKNVGPTRALKFIREYGSIERVLELEPKYSPRVSAQVYLEQVEVARLVFGTLPPVPDTNLLQPGENDENAIQSILERHRLHRLAGYDLDYSSALDGNYFEDNPSAF